MYSAIAPVTYLDDEVENVAETAHAHVHATYLRHEDLHFFHHDIIGVSIIARDTQDLRAHQHNQFP